MKNLNLTIKKEWLDKICSGEKIEEYREIKPYYTSRLNKHYDCVTFINGYSPFSKRVSFVLLDITKGYGKKEWGADPDRLYYVLHLGEQLECCYCGSENAWVDYNEDLGPYLTSSCLCPKCVEELLNNKNKGL